MADFSIHVEADAEIQSAVAWYQTRSRRASVQLIDEVDRVIASIRLFPEMYPAYDDLH